MKGYLEAIRSFRKEIKFYQKLCRKKSTSSSQKIVYYSIILQLEDEVQDLVKKTTDFYLSLSHREKTILARYYYEANTLSDSIYSEDEVISDNELEHAISDNGYKKSIIFKARKWDEEN